MSCSHLRNIKGFDDKGTEKEVCMAVFDTKGYAIAPCCLDESSKYYVSEENCGDYEIIGSEQTEEEKHLLREDERDGV